MQPIGELNNNDADIVYHRKQHLADGLGLALFSGSVTDLRDLRQTVYEVGYLFSETLLDLFESGASVFYHIVKQTRSNADNIQSHLSEDIGDLKRVGQIWLPRFAHLPFVNHCGEQISAAQQIQVVAFIV